MRARAIWLALGTVAAAAAVTAPSEARTADDPCRGKGIFDDLVCQGVSSAPGSTTGYEEAELLCPGGTKMVNTPVSHFSADFNPHTAGWDYWTERGEWITWSGIGSFKRRSVRPEEQVLVGYTPLFHNWWVHDWKLRLFHRCDSVNARPGPAAAARDLDPAPPGDFEIGGPGAQEAGGGARRDVLIGRAGPDELRGGAGNDQVLGGLGDDESHGGSGSDEVFDDSGADLLDGGPGNDRFSAMDADRDKVVCGGGEDVVVADATDSVRFCEHVYTSAQDAPERPPRN